MVGLPKGKIEGGVHWGGEGGLGLHVVARMGCPDGMRRRPASFGGFTRQTLARAVRFFGIVAKRCDRKELHSLSNQQPRVR